jgi:DNA replicative helicase MCM subunit Mcm2 (Cdc46/Mcm family)
MVCGGSVSSAGLYGTVKGQEFELGAIPRAHTSILLVDELGKMTKRIQDDFLGFMESGSVSVSKCGITRTLPAKSTVIAAMNEGFETLSAALRSRFSFLLLIEEQ